MDLLQVLQQLDGNENDENVLVGLGNSDDAAVYKIATDKAIVQTVDYFTPVVDDPYSFGQIAAANALSDIYAMGAKPLFALNIIGFPPGKLPLEVIAQIIRGGNDKAREAGISILGGHTVKDPEPKYGLVVTGIVEPGKVLTNKGALPGDRLILTKPLGIGILTHGLKKGLLEPELANEVIELMSALNRKASEVAVSVGVHACTDVTGFGLLGHLKEMVDASDSGARLKMNSIPVFSEKVFELVEEGVFPGANRCNLDYLGNQLQWDDNIGEAEKLILADPQTSGGLLLAVDKALAGTLLEKLMKEGIPAADIGEIVPGNFIEVK